MTDIDGPEVDNTAPIRVLIVDDQDLVRTGLRLILHAADGIDVVGEADDGVAAVSQSRTLNPDVVLMDVHMPHLDGITATRRILATHPQTRVVVLTTFTESQVVYDALTAGASGFLLKDLTASALVDGIRAVARGEELLAPALTRRLIQQFVAKPAPRLDPRQANQIGRLTVRERDVLTLIARGLSNAEIAHELTLGLETVKTHVSRIIAKLEVRDRVQAVVFAYQTGLANP